MNHVARIFVVCVGVHAAMNRGGLLTFPAALHAAGAGESIKVMHSENWRKQTGFEGSLFALADIVFIYTCKKHNLETLVPFLLSPQRTKGLCKRVKLIFHHDVTLLECYVRL
jgi:hypothetical protein